MRYGFVPVGRDNLEMSCVFIPDGGHAPGALCGGGTAEFRCIFIPDSYDGPPPGYPWVEVGRIVLADATPTRRAATAERPAIGLANEGERLSPSGPATPAPLRVRPPTVAIGGGPDAGSPSSGVADLDITAAMKAWNTLSNPQATLAILDALSPTNLLHTVSAS